MKLDWKPIIKTATKAAEELGHKLRPFGRDTGRGPAFRMVSCEKCGGCAWVQYTNIRGFTAGGRILKYRCGTPEAQGFKSGAGDER